MVCLEIGMAGAVCAPFLGWAFQGVGPSPEAKAAVAKAPPTKVDGLGNALLFGGATPTVALYCGAKVRPESYAPLAQAIIKKLEAAGGSGGVLVLQSPFNVYAFKPATVAKVLEAYPSVTCVAGHSIGGLWAAEFCRDLHEAGAWPGKGLDFFYMGVHGKGISLEQFGAVPFRKVGWSWASEDVTMQRAAAATSQGTSRAMQPSCPRAGGHMRSQGGTTCSTAPTARPAWRRDWRTRISPPLYRRRRSASCWPRRSPVPHRAAEYGATDRCLSTLHLRRS